MSIARKVMAISGPAIELMDTVTGTGDAGFTLDISGAVFDTGDIGVMWIVADTNGTIQVADWTRIKATPPGSDNSGCLWVRTMDSGDTSIVSTNGERSNSAVVTFWRGCVEPTSGDSTSNYDQGNAPNPPPASGSVGRRDFVVSCGGEMGEGADITGAPSGYTLAGTVKRADFDWESSGAIAYATRLTGIPDPGVFTGTVSGDNIANTLILTPA